MLAVLYRNGAHSTGSEQYDDEYGRYCVECPSHRVVFPSWGHERFDSNAKILSGTSHVVHLSSGYPSTVPEEYEHREDDCDGYPCEFATLDRDPRLGAVFARSVVVWLVAASFVFGAPTDDLWNGVLVGLAVGSLAAYNGVAARRVQPSNASGTT